MSALLDEPCRHRDTPTRSHPASSSPAALRMSKRSGATRNPRAQLRALSDPRRSQSISTPRHVKRSQPQARRPRPINTRRVRNLTRRASVSRPRHRARSTTRVEALGSEQAVNTCTRVKVAGYARDTPPRRGGSQAHHHRRYGVASAIVERRRHAANLITPSVSFSRSTQNFYFENEEVACR
jgi:hypothetical protein